MGMESRGSVCNILQVVRRLGTTVYLLSIIAYLLTRLAEYINADNTEHCLVKLPRITHRHYHDQIGCAVISNDQCGLAPAYRCGAASLPFRRA
jgi:hypothetical protein